MLNSRSLDQLMRRPMRRVQHIHFIGIGGVGMAGIAEVLVNLGYHVSGSDLKASGATKRLEMLGAQVFFGHAPENIEHANVVVVSTAVQADNPELQAAHQRQIPVVRRAEMLAEIMRFRYGIAVAGTHGKTTTTSLTASLLAEGGLDPTFVIGGKLLAAGSNARLGAGPYLVAEADESDASFLHLSPLVSIITNIDADHMETYGGSFQKLQETFLEFLQRMPFYGLAVLCHDDPIVRKLLPETQRPYLTYGFSNEANVWAEEVKYSGQGSDFVVCTATSRLPVHVNLPGRHNVLNALAAITVAREVGVDDHAIQRALREFKGVGRRCEVLGDFSILNPNITNINSNNNLNNKNNKNIRLIDDYGHHPTELAATISALKNAYPERRLVVTFQPHRYTRTRDLFEDFAQVLSNCDALVLTEVYSAGEAVITGADGRALASAVRARGRVNPVFVADIQTLPEILPDILQDQDILLTLGAGSISAMAHQLAEGWA